jgi:hypothetical protein
MVSSDGNERTSGTDQCGARVTPGPYGSMTILPDRAEYRLDRNLATTVQHWRWLPDPRILRGLGPNAAVSFRVHSLSGGFRRLVPSMGMDHYSRVSLRIGLEILAHRHALTVERRQDYELMLKLLQRMPATKAYCKRQFSSLTDLKIKRSARGGELSGTDVLPEHLGKTADGGGRKWSIDRLVAEGHDLHELTMQESSGHQQGKACVTSAVRPREVIAYGLMAAADLAPSEQRGDQIHRLMRMALLDMGSLRPTNHEEVLSWVTGRLWAMWNAHLGDTEAKFNSWFQGGHSNLIKSLANLAGYPGGRLAREDVEWALLELTSQSLQYAADCQNVFAQAVAQTIAPRLDLAEKSMFQHWYQPQAYLGGLTLPLIWERNNLLRPVLRRIWLDPDNSHLHAVLWRVLEFYVQMIAARRTADRNVKSTARISRCSLDTSVQDDGGRRELHEWSEVLAVRAGLTCQSRNCPVHYELHGEAEAIVLIGVCSRHGRLSPIQLTLEKAREIIDREDRA